MNSTPLISLEGIRVTLGGRVVLSDISWTLGEGELWTVAGANGAGKSTFLKLLKGDVWPDPVDGGRRRYHFDGETREAPADLKERIALVSPELQERYWRQEWDLFAGKVIESGFFQTDYVARRLTRKQCFEAAAVSRTLGIAHLWERNVQTLSQGELRRVLIARALVSKPVLLLLDEPTHGLDSGSRQELFRVLENVVKEGITVVLTTHRDDERIPGNCLRLYFDSGRIVEKNTAPEAANSVSSSRGSSKRFEGRERLKKKEPIRSANQETKPFQANDSPGNEAPAEPLVSLRGVSVYLGRKRVLQDVHWKVHRGEQWAVVGENGSGKSTLIKTLIGDLHPAWGGKVSRFKAEGLSTLWEVRARVGYLAADFQSAYESERAVREVVASGFFSSVGLMDSPTRAQWEEVDRVLGKFDLESLAHRKFDHLSYGQRRRVLLARSVVHGPQLLALDEPFDGLDAASRRDWMGTLQSLAREGVTLVLITHHEEDLPDWLTHVLKVHAGRVVFQGQRPGQ